jgi:hypothetical protein
MLAKLVLALGCTALPLGCDEADEGDEDETVCEDGKCDAAGAAAAQLAMFNDPIANFLKTKLDKKGQFAMPYLDMLKAIAMAQGCGEDTIDSYVISDDLVADTTTSFPRVVNTLCSTDRTKADLAFFALSFPDKGKVDVDTRTIEMFAWDATAFQYRFYKAVPVKGSKTKMALQIDPSDCKECHTQPEHIEGLAMPMTPIMNELSAPWQHWFAEPQSFDHTVADATQNAPNFKQLAGVGSPLRKSAARLEQTIRSAFTQRIATARLRIRRNPANVDEAMSLLRPLFCDEQLTYVTEDGKSGLLSANATVDEGLASVYFQLMGTGWPWDWWQDKVMRLSPASTPDPLTMMPTRGAATVAYEKQLLAVRALSADQVMRVRALDWHTPTLSSFRCQLWHNALPRVQAAPPSGAKNSDIMGPLLEEILTLHKDDFGIGGTDLPATIPLKSPTSGKFVALASADAASLQDLANKLASGAVTSAKCATDGVGFCLADNNGFGAMVEAHFKAVQTAGRATLAPLRNSRGCEAKTNYPNAPAIKGLTGCE